jgi:predicted PurR-regulated permease PerM
MTMASLPRHPEPAAPPQLVRFELSTRTLVSVGLVVAGVYIAARLVPVLLVLVAALMIVGALNPLVGALEERRFTRNRAIGLIFASGLLLTGLGLFLTIPPLVAQLRDLAEREPEIRTQLVTYLEGSPLTQALADELRNLQYGDLVKSSRGALLNASVHAVEILAYIVAAVFLALYIMVDRDRLRGALFALVPRKHHVRASRVLLNLETIVGGYIRGQVITCVLIGIFMFALLTLCHVPNALALSVFGAVMDVLPYLGALLTIIPAVAAAYVVGPWVGAIVCIAMLLYEELEARLLIPWVYGKILRLPSSVVFLALLVGGALGGIVGALLALPLASAALMLLHELRIELPGEAPRVAAAARRKDKKEEKDYEERSEDAPATEASAIAVEIARVRRDEENGKAAAGK